MIKKTLTIVISLSLVLILASCFDVDQPVKDSVLVTGQSYIAYITQDDNVFFVDWNGNKKILQDSEGVTKVLGDNQVLILLHSDGIVDVRHSDTGAPLTEQECLNNLEKEEAGTKNGTIANYINLCKYFESHSDIQDILFVDSNCYVVKIDGKWYGDLIDGNPMLKAVSPYRIIGSVGSLPEYVLNEDGKIIRLPEASSAEFLMPDASRTYIDAACYEEPYFVGSDGYVYTMGPRKIPEFHDAVTISTGFYMTAIIDKKGKAQIKSNSTSEEYKEALEWNNLVFLAVDLNSLIGIDRKGNVKFTSSIEDRFNIDYKELPKAKVK